FSSPAATAKSLLNEITTAIRRLAPRQLLINGYSVCALNGTFPISRANRELELATARAPSPKMGARCIHVSPNVIFTIGCQKCSLRCGKGLPGGERWNEWFPFPLRVPND